MKLKVAIINLLSVILLLSIAMPARADMLGIDVSRWQGEVNWDEVNRQVSFALIKAGGADMGAYMDSQFQRNRDEVRRLGIPHGYYYYAGGGNPIEEAEHFASLVAPLQPGEVVVLDFEVDHPNPVGFAQQFMVRTEELLGVKPLLYTYMNKIWSHDWQPVASYGYQLWGAIYDEEPYTRPPAGAWPSLTIKQYTSSGTLRGIDGHLVDMNYFSMSAQDFLALGMPAPVAPAVPAAPALTDYEGVKTAVPGPEESAHEAPLAGIVEETGQQGDALDQYEDSGVETAPSQDYLEPVEESVTDDIKSSFGGFVRNILMPWQD